MTLELRRPRAVPPGGTIGIAAPAGPIDAEQLARGEAHLREAGFETLRREDVLSRQGYLAGDDERRAKELEELIADERVDAVLCARGGYGAHRIMARLDARRFREARKPLVGYSDVTTLLLWQLRCAGLVGWHGPMLEREIGLDPEEVRALAEALTGTGPEQIVLRGCPGGGGCREGRLVGGSLSLVTASLATPWEIECEGAILLLEDVTEAPYRIDRMLQQLAHAGKLRGLVGLGVGALSRCEASRPGEPEALEVVEEIARPLGIPLVTGLPFGHTTPNLPWPLGIRAALDGARGELVLLERGVESG